MDTIIVSRHPAAIEFIARELGGTLEDMSPLNTDGGWCPVRKNLRAAMDSHRPLCAHISDTEATLVIYCREATSDDVRGKHVYGNLPLHLAALAAQVTVVEFTGQAPRGQEYSLTDMDAAGAVLRSYVVQSAPRLTVGDLFPGMARDLPPVPPRDRNKDNAAAEAIGNLLAGDVGPRW